MRRTPLGDPRVCQVYYGTRVYAPYTDPRVCHVYYGAIGTLLEGYARCKPLGDPWVSHVYYSAIGTRGMCAVHHWVTHGYATYTTVL